jgi:S-adenosylmethionine:tRNA ribosyltransferase-isomerase
MRPAQSYPDRRDDVRLLVIDPAAPAGEGLRETRTPALPDLLAAGDLLVVNDAATLPAALYGRDAAGHPIEARLVSAGQPATSGAGDDDRFWAVLFGAGDWRARTEDRPPPPPLPVGARLDFGALAAEIVGRSPVSPRLVELRFDRTGDALWSALYAAGRPVRWRGPPAQTVSRDAEGAADRMRPAGHGCRCDPLPRQQRTGPAPHNS